MYVARYRSPRRSQQRTSLFRPHSLGSVDARTLASPAHLFNVSSFVNGLEAWCYEADMSTARVVDEMVFREQDAEALELV